MSRGRGLVALVTAWAVLTGLAGPAVAADAAATGSARISAAAAGSIAAAAADAVEPRPMPESLYRDWDGRAGVDLTGDPRLRQLVADIAELAEDVEVREAAAAALAVRTDDAIMEFLDSGESAAQAQARARKQETARRNKKAVEALDGTGGQVFNAEVKRVLAGSDADREAFLAYGAEIARHRDEQAAASAKARADQLRARVTILAGSPGAEVRQAAQAALEAGDQAIAAFLNGGYLAAAKRDAEERERYLADQAEREKAADELSELARKAARASTARKHLLVAHGQGVRALQRASNAMVSAGIEARKAEQILAANNAGGQHPAGAFDAVKAEVARQLGYAEQAAAEAQQASASATVQANILVETGLTDGAEWARMAQGMAEASRAAVQASATARHAIEATAATDAARDGQAKAEARAEQARQWRIHAQEHAKAAAALAAAARVQAQAARDAAVRTKAAREAAEQAEAAAWAAARRTHEARLTAEAEQRKAAAARAVAERERANAAAARARAEQQAAVARAARGQAQQQAGIAAGARRRAEEHEGVAERARGRAESEERNAAAARDRAVQEANAARVAEAKAQAMEAWAAASRGGAAGDEARQAAAQARGEANTASGAAVNARTAANTATGAAANARAAATEATRAAARARAAAREAEAAAARANAAANKAEAEAAATHAAATQANVKAAEATAAETQAAEAAQAAVRLAEQAAAEASASLRAAERTKAEAEAASAEAVSAAAQAQIAVRASTAARASSAAITDPANTAIGLTAPFTGADLDADFVTEVANAARTMGAEQAAAAQQRAAEAVTAAQQAQQAADRAAAEVKPAFDAAAAAASSASAAARSAAEATAAAAQAAVDGAAARAAGARANQADAQAHDDAVAARRAANLANQDAAIAGRSAAAAERDATAARSAASAAERDAATARAAATAAEQDAAAARSAADRAQEHADAASKAAANALGSAIEAQQAYERAEKEAREAQAQRERDAAGEAGRGGPELSPEDEELLEDQCGDEDCVEAYKAALAAAGKGILDFIKENGAEIILDFIGVNDAIKCFRDGDVAACLWTLVNVASLVAVVGKGAALGKAISKISGGLAKFLEQAAKARKAVDKYNDMLRKAKVKCDVRGAASVSGVTGARVRSGPAVAVRHDRATAVRTVVFVQGVDPCEIIKRAPELAAKAARTPADIFIKNKHLASFGGRYAKFATDDIPQAQAWVAEGLRSEGLIVHSNGEGSIKVFANLGRPIGTKGEQWIRILINEEGKVFNAFPAKGAP